MNTTEPASRPKRTRRAGKITGGIVLIVVGFLFLATAPFLSDFTAETAPYESDAYAVVGDSWDESSYGGDGLIESASIEITPSGDAPVFAGLIPADEADAFLGGIGRTLLHRGTAEHGPTTEDVAGDAPAGLPGDSDVWAAQIEGTGVQTLDLGGAELEGEYVPVVMNADGTAGVGGEVVVEYEIPMLPWATAGLVILGLIGLGGGVWLLIRAKRA
ncbi:hypothetical protein [Glycomyces buryatensis]|uniref:Uncharacterized protein n=1 Tax=Glycomyces buryatensis TaxID=2570927 RepID=A0A4V4HSS5_9ACTN|nr:hypothetical protein [Glycomyces buryatensis]THV42846.1 hypothetical protein FAB82_03580 [Glycomyces buryatensis]